MRFISYITNFLLFLAIVSCADLFLTVRKIPNYKDVDPAFISYYNEFMDLATLHGVKFSHNITMGFTDIKQEHVVGITNYGVGFREIDIDSTFWWSASRTSRVVLEFHELTHAFCGRDHDYHGESYGDGEDARKNHPKKDMVFEDGCPRSIMYPLVLDDRCFVDHYNELTSEMFEGCNAY